MKKETKTETEKENKKNSGKNIDKKSKDIKKSIYEQGYDISDIIDEVEMDPDINTNTKKALSGWLYDLQRLHIFGKSPAPLVKNLAKVGELTIIDLSPIISKRKKQILLHYITNKLFYMRRTERVPPFILFLEEAHNFIPESGGKHAIAKPIFEKMAREGRKFFAQLVLISQRPVHLSTTALSQCNTQIIMRITNPYDLDHIKSTSEALTRNSMKIINTLPTGNALIMGTALNFPVFVDVRERYIQDLYSHKSILDACKKFLKNPKGHSKVDLVRENDSNEEEEKDQNNWEDPSEQIMSEQKTNSGSKNFTFFDVLD